MDACWKFVFYNLLFLFFPPVSSLLLGPHITTLFDLDCCYLFNSLIVIFYSRSFKNYKTERIATLYVDVSLKPQRNLLCCLPFSMLCCFKRSNWSIQVNRNTLSCDQVIDVFIMKRSDDVCYVIGHTEVQEMMETSLVSIECILESLERRLPTDPRTEAKRIFLKRNWHVSEVVILTTEVGAKDPWPLGRNSATHPGEGILGYCVHVFQQGFKEERSEFWYFSIWNQLTTVYTYNFCDKDSYMKGYICIYICICTNIYIRLYIYLWVYIILTNI